MQRQNDPIINNETRNDFGRSLRISAININWITSLLNLLFVVALCLTVLEINIYRNTLVHWAIPTTIWFLTGLILTPLSSNLLEKHYNITIDRGDGRLCTSNSVNILE